MSILSGNERKQEATVPKFTIYAHESPDLDGFLLTTKGSILPLRQILILVNKNKSVLFFLFQPSSVYLSYIQIALLILLGTLFVLIYQFL